MIKCITNLINKLNIFIIIYNLYKINNKLNFLNKNNYKNIIKLNEDKFAI